jgi:hypothetical protein
VAACPITDAITGKIGFAVGIPSDGDSDGSSGAENSGGNQKCQTKEANQ